MGTLKINIIAYVDDWYPGWVKCIFKDANNKEWSFIEKVPVVTVENLTAGSKYPIEGYVECEILNKSSEIVKINLSNPLGIQTEDGRTIFEVHENQIIISN